MKKHETIIGDSIAKLSWSEVLLQIDLSTLVYFSSETQIGCIFAKKNCCIAHPTLSSLQHAYTHLQDQQIWTETSENLLLSDPGLFQQK